MVDHTSRLPDEVLGYILSFLTVRDSVRARLTSSRWLQLPDPRSVLCLDSLNVLGVENIWEARPSLQSMFVRIVNRYMDLSMGNRIGKLTCCFDLGNEHASHIDGWIATSIAMEVEEIELRFRVPREERYVFPSHLLCFGNAHYLKRLSLTYCKIISSQCTSWLSNLTALCLYCVRLDQSGWQHILSAGSNLTLIELISCSLRGTIFINGQLLHLKKFITSENHLDSIKLNCPILEKFRYFGGACSFYFVHVPTLKEATVQYPYDEDGYYSELFNHVTRNAPQLEALTLRILSEVQLFCATLATCSLKRLYLETMIPLDFDFFNFTNVFNACPFLEKLEIVVEWYNDVEHSQRREYPDRPHFHLKKVELTVFQDQWNVVEFAMYILRNTVALEEMVIALPGWASEAEQEATTLLLEKKIHPTAEVIIAPW